jgi:hypothetical protein
MKFTMENEIKTYQKVVVFLDPEKCKTVCDTDIVIKNISQLVADGGELIIMAPGVTSYGDELPVKHLEQSSSDGKFTIVYCTKGLSKNDIESIGYQYGNINEKLMLYNPAKLKPGINTFRCGTQIYFINYNLL